MDADRRPHLRPGLPSPVRQTEASWWRRSMAVVIYTSSTNSGATLGRDECARLAKLDLCCLVGGRNQTGGGINGSARQRLHFDKFGRYLGRPQRGDGVSASSNVEPRMGLPSVCRRMGLKLVVAENIYDGFTDNFDFGLIYTSTNSEPLGMLGMSSDPRFIGLPSPSGRWKQVGGGGQWGRDLHLNEFRGHLDADQCDRGAKMDLRCLVGRWHQTGGGINGSAIQRLHFDKFGNYSV